MVARSRFGGGPADWAAVPGLSGTVTFTGGTGVLYSAATGGTQYTDLATDAAATHPISTVTVGDGTLGTTLGEIPVFYGPPGVTEMWLSIDSGPRVLITANDTATGLGTHLAAINPHAVALESLSDVGILDASLRTDGDVLTWSQAGGQFELGPPQAVSGGGNLIPNPSFDDGLTGWTAPTGTTASLENVAGLFRAKAGKIARTTAAGTGTVTAVSPAATVKPRQVYSFAGYCRLATLGGTTPRAATVTVRWYDAIGSLISSTTSAPLNQSIQGTWLRVALADVVSPDTVDHATVEVSIAGVPEGENHLVGAVQLQPGAMWTEFPSSFGDSTFPGSVLVPGAITDRETAAGSAKPLYGAAASRPAAGTPGRLYAATDTGALYLDTGTAWVALGGGGAGAPVGVFDFPFTIDPRIADAARALTGNNIYYFRLQGAGSVNGWLMRLGAGVAGGFVNVALYTSTGSGRSAVPGAKVSGSDLTVTATAAGDTSASYGSPITVTHGMWLGVSPSSTTITLLTFAANSGSAIAAGLAYVQTVSGGGPTLPSTPGALSGQTATPAIVGI